MSLQGHKSPLIPQGWIRATLLLFIYTALSIAGGFFIPTMDLWFIFSSITSLILVSLAWKYIDRRHFSSIGFRSSHFLSDSLSGFLLGLLLIGAGSLLIFSFNELQWVNVEFNEEDFFTSAFLLFIIAISEELVFRGYILRNLMKSFNEWIALAVSALLFASVHFTNPGIPATGVINIILGGLVLGLTFMYTRNLGMPIFFHFSWNFFQGPVLGFPVSGLPFGSLFTIEFSGTDLITGGSFGFEGSIICTIILLTTFIVLLLLYRRRN